MNDLELYGNRFTVDGERVHPSRVRIEWVGEAQKPFQIPNIDRMSRREIEEEVGITQMEFTTVPVFSDADGGYEIPQHVTDSLNRFFERFPPTLPAPVPDFALSSLLTSRDMT